MLFADGNRGTLQCCRVLLQELSSPCFEQYTISLVLFGIFVLICVLDDTFIYLFLFIF